MKLSYLHEVNMGTMFRTAKWADVFRQGDPAAPLGSIQAPTCMYLRCHCIYVVTGPTLSKMRHGTPTYRTVDVVWRCSTGTHRHEDTHRTMKYRQERRLLPMGTVNAWAKIVVIDPLTVALATEIAA